MLKFVPIFYTYSSNHSLLHFLALDIQIKVHFGFNILSCNPFYILYLLLITVRRPAFGLTLDINKEKYTKLSVILFPVVLRVANFLLSLFCSVVSLLCRKPVAGVLHQLCKVLIVQGPSSLAVWWRFGIVLYAGISFVCI